MRLIATQSNDELQMQLQLPVAASSIVTAWLRSSLFKRGNAALNMIIYDIFMINVFFFQISNIKCGGDSQRNLRLGFKLKMQI